MKRTTQRRARSSSTSNRAFVAAAVVYSTFGPASSIAIPITTYSEMPTDSVAFLSIDPVLFLDTLRADDVAVDFAVYRQDGQWGGDSTGWLGGSPLALDDLIAPSGLGGIRTAVRFTFAEPVYAVGGTVFASPFAFGDFSAGGLSRNLGNTLVTVSAFGLDGTLLEAVAGSNYGTTNGPTRLIAGGTRDELMASFAGTWRAEPIRQVTFVGVNPGEGSLFANLASFSFSRAPLVTVAEPGTLSLFLLGLMALIMSRRGNSSPESGH